MKRLIFCLVANIIVGICVIMTFFAQLVSYNMVMEQYQSGGSSSLSLLLGRQRTYLIIEAFIIAIIIVCIIFLASLIKRENKREENRPIVINQNGTINESQTTYFTPGYSGGADHRVNPQDFGGNING